MPVIEYRQMNDASRYVGESHPKAKLTDVQVDEIRELHESQGVTVYSLAQRFGVSQRTLRDIVNYRTRAQTVTRIVKYVRPE